jgi:hypothetical protein
MKCNSTIFKLGFLLFSIGLFAQETPKPAISQERNPDKFKQMYDLLATEKKPLLIPIMLKNH